MTGEKLSKLINDCKAREEIGNLGRQPVLESFNIEKVAKELAQHFGPNKRKRTFPHGEKLSKERIVECLWTLAIPMLLLRPFSGCLHTPKRLKPWENAVKQRYESVITGIMNLRSYWIFMRKF